MNPSSMKWGIENNSGAMMNIHPVEPKGFSYSGVAGMYLHEHAFQHEGTNRTKAPAKADKGASNKKDIAQPSHSCAFCACQKS